MTPSQTAAIKADILANADLNAFPNTADGAFAIADLYNAAAAAPQNNAGFWAALMGGTA